MDTDTHGWRSKGGSWDISFPRIYIVNFIVNYIGPNYVVDFVAN